MNLESLRNKLLNISDIKTVYDELKPEFEKAKEVIKWRNQNESFK